ncbi:MAG: GAF domain-containing protein [Chloroflexi bacterium]|nr:GAF domain-containing protein [Chloroflexota bacterium]
MLQKNLQTSHHKWWHRLARRRRGVAIAAWFFFETIALIDLAHNVDLYGAGFLRDGIEISGYVTDPLLIALLVYIALRAVSRQARALDVAEAIVSNAPIGILTTDARGRITFVNETGLQLMNEANLKAVPGARVQELPPLRGTLLEKNFADALRGDAFLSNDVEYTMTPGKSSYLTMRGVPLRDTAGQVDGILVLMEDTTERRQWQREIQTRSDQTQRHVRELEILREVSVAATSTLELDEVLRLVYERVRTMMHTNTFFIALYDDQTQDLHFEFLMDNGVAMPKYVQRLTSFGGLSGWIIQHREPLLTADLAEATNLPTQPGTFGTMSRAFLGVPLVVQDRVIGVMSVQSYQPNQFDQDHLRLMVAIANQISIIIENARLFSEMRVTAEEFRVAHDIARAINSTLNLTEVLNLFFERVNALFNVEAGSLLLLDPQTNELVFEVVHGGAGESLLHKRMRSDKGIVGWVTMHGESVLVPDVRQDARWFSEVDSATRYVTRSILSAPIRVQARTIGAIELINRRNGNPFNETDQKLLEMFAVSAGIAIENARLHRQTEQRLAEVSMLNTIANQLASSLELDEILNSVATRLRSLFNCRAVSIHLLNAEKKFLNLQASSGLAPERPFQGITMGTGVAGRVARDGTFMHIRRAQEAPADARICAETQSLLSVPLASRERILGTLSLDSSQSNAFSEDDQRLLTIVASQIATAIENAQLYRDLKERAAHLRRAFDELKELDRLKTEFTQNVSHELRTPLTFIKGYVELLREENLGEFSPKAREALDIVANKTDALIHLVNSILTFQQVESGKLRVETLEIQQLVHQAVLGASASAGHARVELIEAIAPNLPPLVGDAERLTQVLDNLLANAIKFSPDGGTVRVRVGESDGFIQVDVQDSGVGIPPEKLSHVFDRFYQVDGSATRRFGGTGLGLAIVKRIVESHRGRVWAESVEGKGSTFSFTLPKNP